MLKYLLTAAAVAAIATPAAARDHSAYVGVDAGALFDVHTTTTINAANSYYCYEISYYFDNCAATFRTRHKTGWDADLVYGYDFGRFRLEGEAAMKHAKQKDYFNSDGSVDAGGRTRAWSLMLNGLVDLGPSRGINFSFGGGVGYGHTSYRFKALNTDGYLDPLTTTLDRGQLAWQLLAEVRAPISRNLDVGLKYRYYDGGSIHQNFADANGVDGSFDVSTHFRSHSVLASLVYNFVSAPPPPPPPPVTAPPPPPPPAPATQTCPDGSVIEATATCPVPPPPPPPPPTQKGERG